MERARNEEVDVRDGLVAGGAVRPSTSIHRHLDEQAAAGGEVMRKPAKHRRRLGDVLDDVARHH